MNNKIDFNFDEVHNIMSRIQEEAHNIQSYLNECDSIVNENVNVPNRWCGQRATSFKEDWMKTSSEFDSFVKEIDGIVGKIEMASTEYKKVENA